MRIKSNKELAILLVSMVFCMMVMVVGELHTDSRVDKLVAENTRLSIEIENLRQQDKCFAKPLSDAYFADSEKENSVLYALPTEDLVTCDTPGYDFDYVCRVVTAEGSRDAEVCMGVAQCLFNACEKYGWQYNPDEMLAIYQYASPSNWASEEAVDACLSVFFYGNRYEPVRNATVFYAPQYCDSEWHEEQSFVCEINGVRFFEENC